MSSAIVPIALALFLASGFVARRAPAEIIDPLADGPVNPDLFPRAATAPTNVPAVVRLPPAQQEVKVVDFQTVEELPPKNPTPANVDTSKAAAAAPGPIASQKDPCAAVPHTPITSLGINIAEPAGKLPTDLATACWEKINQKSNALAATRCWPVFVYEWDATCFCHQPLYFEEANLERYGYQCGDKWCCTTCGQESCCLQPAASAFHFFGTIPALPYCIATQCPDECIYTLGHYRPGDCNPWRWYWPDFDPVAAAAAGGFWVGMIAAFP